MRVPFVRRICRVISVGAALVAAQGSPRDCLHTAGAAAAPGDRVPPFALCVRSGAVARWQPEKVTVLSFCALWCDTWKEQRRRLAAAAATVRGLPVTFLTISVDGRWSERWPGTTGDGESILLDVGGGFSRSLGIRTVPFTIVADAQGRVRFAVQGVLRPGVLPRAIRDAQAAGAAPREGVVYLTFDDFPAGSGDDALLDLLRAEGVPATFFCIGRNVLAHPAVVRRAAREGHSLQLHAWDHSAEKPELARCAHALKSVTGGFPSLYRPPGRAAVQRLDGTLLPTSVVNPYDYQRPGEEEIVRRVLLAARSGSTLLFHAGVSETRAALPRILRGLRRQGLSFGVLR